MSRGIAVIATLFVALSTAACAAPADEEVSEDDGALREGAEEDADSIEAFGRFAGASGTPMTRAMARQWVADAAIASDEGRVWRGPKNRTLDHFPMAYLSSFERRTRTCEADGTRCGPWSRTELEAVDGELREIDTETGDKIELRHVRGGCNTHVSCGAFGGAGRCSPAAAQTCVEGVTGAVRYVVKVTKTFVRVTSEHSFVDARGKRVEIQRAAANPLNKPWGNYGTPPRGTSEVFR